MLRNKTLILCLFFLLIGLVVGILIPVNFYKPSPQNTIDLTNLSSEFHGDGNQFINPLYECNTSQAYGEEKLGKLQSTIQGYISQITKKSTIKNVAVYFRDLNNGPWFGINEHEAFSPSSLLKVPVMMAFYKEAEADPSILTKQIKYTTNPPGLISQNFPPPNPMQKGKSYTIDDLINRMIEGSDNVALLLLEQNISEQKINQVTIDLGITTATNSTPMDFMDVEEYSTLFRVLYYATYLNQDYSEKALQLLSKSEFTQGLRASIPQYIPVSHKFGERDILPAGTHQLHDCGIVYYPSRPYLICIMTRGSDFNDLEKTIQQVSSKIYTDYSNEK